jgi:hypothetical protein
MRLQNTKTANSLEYTVEKCERRNDAQFARKIIVVQQREFDLKEQIEILREYIMENFVDKCINKWI